MIATRVSKYFLGQSSFWKSAQASWNQFGWEGIFSHSFSFITSTELQQGSTESHKQGHHIKSFVVLKASQFCSDFDFLCLRHLHFHGAFHFFSHNPVRVSLKGINSLSDGANSEFLRERLQTANNGITLITQQSEALYYSVILRVVLFHIYLSVCWEVTDHSFKQHVYSSPFSPPRKSSLRRSK